MQATSPFIVYRDRIGAPSETEFLRRQYIGFQRLSPVWVGRTILPGAPFTPILRLGGPWQRLLFRYLGRAPRIDIPGLAPIVHAQFARGGALALPLAANARLWVTLHGGDVSKTKNWSGTVLARRWPALVHQAAGFVAVSQAVADIALARGVPAAKLHVLPIGVELPPTMPATTPESFLFVGRFVEKKGIAVLCDAIRRLRATGDPTPLICVGDGPLRPLLEALARDLPGVALTGWLPPAAVAAQMTRAVALLVPSVIASDGDAEGLPSVVVEAMAAGCTVIGSDQGGIAEAIQSDRTGLLVPPGDPAALAAAMHRLVTNPSLPTRLAASAFAQAAVRFNAMRQSQKLEALLLGP